MAAESPEDLAIFFDPRDFGEAGGALYAARSGETPYVVDGIFDVPSSEFKPNRWPGHPYQMQEGAALVMSSPTFMCARSALVKGGRARDTLTIGDTVWTVLKALPDGTGAVVLHLSDSDEDAAK